MGVARVETVVDTLFGHRLEDPYRWMERGGPEFREWIDGQAADATRYLGGLPGRAELLARVAELTASSVRMTMFATAGERVFFRRQNGDADVPVLVVREGDAERVLLDPAELPGAEHHALDWYEPSPDGTRIACGISPGGSEEAALHILDVATGELHDTVIPGAFHGVVSWLPDGSGILFHRCQKSTPDTPPARRRHDSGTFLHRFDGSGDTLILARDHNDRVPLSPTDRPFVLLPGDSDWMIAVISHSALAGSVTEGLSDCTLYTAPKSALADPNPVHGAALPTPPTE